jgi:hypothetical protein
MSLSPTVPNQVRKWLNSHKERGGYLDLEWNSRKARWMLVVRFNRLNPNIRRIGNGKLIDYSELITVQGEGGEYIAPDSPLIRKIVDQCECRNESARDRFDQKLADEDARQKEEDRTGAFLVRETAKELSHAISFYLKQQEAPGMIRTGPVMGL